MIIILIIIIIILIIIIIIIILIIIIISIKIINTWSIINCCLIIKSIKNKIISWNNEIIGLLKKAVQWKNFD
jgi:hypothetical protein